MFLSSIKHFLSQNRHFANLNPQTECIDSKGKLTRKPLEANAFRKKSWNLFLLKEATCLVEAISFSETDFLYWMQLLLVEAILLIGRHLV